MSSIDPSQPMSIGAFIAVIGVIITWVAFGIMIYNARAAAKKSRRDDEEHLEDVILKVCEAFTKSDSYLLRRDKEMISVAQAVTEEAFRVRASSFVDARTYSTHRENDRERMDRFDSALLTVQKDFKEAAGKIAAEVTTQMAKLLRKNE